MKKLICVLLCGLLTLCTGCKQPEKNSFSVVATIFPYYDFARQMVGDFGQVTMLLPPGGEVHGFEPTLQDVAAIENCQVFIYNGGEGDGWVESILENIDVSNKQIIRMTDHVDLLMSQEEHHDHTHHHDQQEADQHIFTIPQNARIFAKVIADALSLAAPDRQAQIAAGYEPLAQQLAQLEQDYGVLYGATKQLVVADRFPFVYVTHTYGLSYVAAFSGCTANTEGTVKTLYDLLQAANNTGVILCTEFSNGQMAQTVAAGVGGRVARWHSCHNVTQEEWDKGVTYVELMNQNLVVLKGALGL